MACRSNTLGIGASIEIPLFDRNQGKIAIERALRQKLYDEYMYRIFAARADIAEVLNNIQNLNREIIQLESATIPAQKSLLETYKKSLEMGQGDVLVYYDSLILLIRKQIALFDLKQQLISAKSSLALTSGYYNPEDALLVGAKKHTK